MKDGDRLLAELKQKAITVRKLRGLMLALLLPGHEPDKVGYYKENRN